MDELEISGRRYISAARAAKEHKYHSDYIGQLIRGKKVAGQKVGRAWYVDADSLSEYLGKEVPARGPVIKKEKTVQDAMLDQKVSDFVAEETVELATKKQVEEVLEKPVAEPKIDVRGFSTTSRESDLNEIEEAPFVMPLRKSGRAHTIAAIGEVSTPKIEKKPAHIEPVKEIFVEEIVAEEIEEPEVETTVVAEQETFIPLKISKENTAHNIYAEPEDSFYKVSRKGLRYVKPTTHRELLQEARAIPVPARSAVTEKREGGRRVYAVLSLVLLTGIVSLGAGVLMSYYLHSITTVQGTSQTSSVLLSNQ